MLECFLVDLGGGSFDLLITVKNLLSRKLVSQLPDIFSFLKYISRFSEKGYTEYGALETLVMNWLIWFGRPSKYLLTEYTAVHAYFICLLQ